MDPQQCPDVTANLISCHTGGNQPEGWWPLSDRIYSSNCSHFVLSLRFVSENNN